MNAIADLTSIQCLGELLGLIIYGSCPMLFVWDSLYLEHFV